MREGIAIYEFFDQWEARLARDALDDAGIEAWMEQTGGGIAQEGPQRFRVYVQAEDADEARAVLTEPLPELPDYEPHERVSSRRPMWIPLVAAIVVMAMIFSVVRPWMWPWILLVGLVGFLFWRTAGPRRP